MVQCESPHRKPVMEQTCLDHVRHATSSYYHFIVVRFLIKMSQNLNAEHAMIKELQQSRFLKEPYFIILRPDSGLFVVVEKIKKVESRMNYSLSKKTMQMAFIYKLLHVSFSGLSEGRFLLWLSLLYWFCFFLIFCIFTRLKRMPIRSRHLFTTLYYVCHARCPFHLTKDVLHQNVSVVSLCYVAGPSFLTHFFRCKDETALSKFYKQWNSITRGCSDTVLYSLCICRRSLFWLNGSDLETTYI